MSPLVASLVATPLGPLRLLASDLGLRAVLWEHHDPARARRGLPDPVMAVLGHDRGPAAFHLVTAAEQLAAYFDGTRRAFTVPLYPVGTPFQLTAWRALVDIPYGTTRSYGEHATALGRPGAARAVGAATGRNPLSIVVPCHRLVAADGSLAGFAGGLEAKRSLLALERRVVETT